MPYRLSSKDDADGYIEHIIADILPALAVDQGLREAVDVFL